MRGTQTQVDPRSSPVLFLPNTTHCEHSAATQHWTAVEEAALRQEYTRTTHDIAVPYTNT